MELVLRPQLRNTSHRILGTSPASSVLDISNETDIPRVPPYRITDILTQVMSWVARCHPDTAIAWLQPSCGPKLVPNGDGIPKHTSCQDYRRYLIRVTAARSLPTLVNTRKRTHRYTASRPARTGNCGCTKRARFGGTWSTFRLGA